MTQPRADAIRTLTFTAAGRPFALDALDVAEVLPLPRVTRVPQSPPALLGVANLRGRVAPIVSVGALLGEPVDAEATRVVVVDRGAPIGLAVESVEAVRSSAGVGDSTPRLDLDTLLAHAFAGLAARPRALRAGPGHATAAPAAREAEAAFLRVVVAGQAYGLPLEQVQEVAVLPAAATALPRTDVAMLGAMPFRGGLVALVSLRAVLGLPVVEATPASRVVLVTLGKAILALLVDEARAVTRARERDIGPVPAVLNRGAGEARIDAIVRTREGLLPVLTVEHVLDEESAAAVIAEGARSGAAGETAANDESLKVEQFVVFRLADETYGLSVSAVVEVVRLPAKVSRLPRAPAFVLGLMNHRGAALPLIDQARRFVVKGAPDERRRQVILVRLDDLVAGFLVDDVEQVLSVPVAQLQAAPDLASADAPVFDRIATLDVDGRLVLLIDPGQLLDQAQRDVVRTLADQAGAAPA